MIVAFKKEVYPIKEVLSRIGKEHMIFNGEFVYMGDPQYQLIAEKGTKCSTCNNKGSYFIKEASLKESNLVFDFGLYGQDRDENEIKFFAEDNRIICQSCKEKKQ